MPSVFLSPIACNGLCRLVQPGAILGKRFYFHSRKIFRRVGSRITEWHKHFTPHQYWNVMPSTIENRCGLVHVQTRRPSRQRKELCSVHFISRPSTKECLGTHSQIVARHRTRASELQRRLAPWKSTHDDFALFRCEW